VRGGPVTGLRHAVLGAGALGVLAAMHVVRVALVAAEVACSGAPRRTW
jgi:hypothetical protein